MKVFYFSDDTELTALRYKDWKIIFLEQKVQTTLRAWMGNAFHGTKSAIYLPILRT